MGRAHRIQQDEYPYHVTTGTSHQRLILRKWLYKIIIAVLHEATERFDARIEHFKMMDNHYHMKIITPSSNISEIMWYINNQIAKRFNRRQGVRGHLWGERFHASIIEDDEYAARCVSYIYNNGVRAGLCRRASEDSRMSTFDFYAKGKRIGFVVTEDGVYIDLGRDAEERRRNFILMVDKPYTNDEIRAIQNGLRKRFYGSADFIERMGERYRD